jgi:hypothetical protein
LSLALAGLQGLRASRSRVSQSFPRYLSWTSTSLQRTPKYLAAIVPFPVAQDRSDDSSLEVPSPTAFPCMRQRLIGRDCLPRPPAPSGFLNLLALRSAPRLLALFRARSAHGVCPSKLFSSRAAVRCFQRQYPLAVQDTLRPLPKASSCRKHRSAAPKNSLPYWEGPQSAPRLQGFAPRESPPLRYGCLGRNERVALLGFLLFRAFPLGGMATVFTAPPLMSLAVGRRIGLQLSLQGLTSTEVGLSLSRLPALLRFATL